MPRGVTMGGEKRKTRGDEDRMGKTSGGTPDLGEDGRV